MECPSCAHDLPEEATFCAFCGMRVHRCASCARVYPEDVGFCGHCGVPLDADDDAHSIDDIEFASDDARSTSPGRPGSRLQGGTPTFMLPSAREERDPDVYGFLYDPLNPNERHRLKTGDNTLGAGHNNDIIIDRPAISWNHALVICRNGKIFLQDSASTNGTFVDDERIDRPYQLHHGQRVRFGNVGFDVWLKAQYRTPA